jgi:hypothetical protein
VLAGGFVLYRFAVHALAWHEARWAATQPGAAVRLTPLDRTNMLNVRSTAVEAFGWTFAIPGEPVTQNDGKTFKTFRVPGNGSVAIMLPGPGSASMYRPMPTMRKIFTDSELSSEFAFTKAEIAAEPGEVSFWNSRTHNVRLMELLMFKSMLGPNATALHPVGSGAVQGFETVMQVRGTVFHVHLYDSHDERIELLCRAPTDVDPQAWMNAILASIQPPNVQSATQ